MEGERQPVTALMSVMTSLPTSKSGQALPGQTFTSVKSGIDPYLQGNCEGNCGGCACKGPSSVRWVQTAGVCSPAHSPQSLTPVK